MNAVQLIKQDHQQVNQLFQQYQSSKQRQIGDQICQELEIHATVEEQVFYPAAQQKGGELARLIEEAMQEHQQAKSLISQLKGTQEDGQYATLMQQLQQGIEHHVQEEESQLLPQAESQMAGALDQLGSQMEQQKQSMKAA